ncbi:MAG: Stp1/IreP family PP2C-type Ser/Thr phosphatase [Clostridia bacterium]|nr:Stp1/IreP family PP2C-type Ser/Thr phosphatase [Clostridia bacterium]
MLLGCATDTGLMRDTNEDACFADRQCLAVADGMGGHNAGEVAAGIAIRTVASYCGQWDSGDDVDVAACIAAANWGVLEASRSSESLAGMGTTLTVAAVRKGVLHLGHVGDSRAYLVRGDVVSQLTTDHSVVGELVRSGLITPEEAETHPQRHAITRALGFCDRLDIDTRERCVAPGDVILLSTDGFHDVIGAQEMAAVVSTAEGPQDACALLVGLACARGGHDNITVAMGTIEESDIGWA